MMETGVTALHLYGFVRPSLDAAALADLGARHGVFLVEFDDVACAVSAATTADCEGPPEATGTSEQLAWLTPRASRHHDVLQRLHAAGDVVPLRFGALCGDAAQVRAIIRDLQGQIEGALVRLSGKDEWTLKIGADARACEQGLRDTDRELARLADHAATLPPGRAYFLRKKLARTTAELLEIQFASLEIDAYDGIVGACAEIGTPERPRMQPAGGTAIVARTPLLVDRDSIGRLEPVLAALETRHAAMGARFELIGPWPPYSFAPVLVAPEAGVA